MKNYTKLQTKFIEDIQSNVTVYQHNKTGARICTIENDDSNKVFSIAFRTPPINNGGLTHILEHSVLCGSKKYPVKDPFVELMKGSLNTFLNAFTFPDKTMYPCASKNHKDFKNLMSVYMDAVFYPQIYAHEEIFMQEGWHYHILNEEDPITYNGVVYNEMKGAFSDPQQVLVRNVIHSLFPDTPYGLESGGDPKYIPDLEYKEFLEFHSKFYHPTNSYIFLYGDCCMQERLEWLDEEYLSNFDKIDFDTQVPYQTPFKEAIYEEDYYPLDPNLPLDNKTFLTYNVAFPSTLDTKKMIAANILVDVLLNNPGAPLKQALIDAKLGSDVQAFFDDGILQPILSIIVMNSNQDKEKEFIDIINNSLKDILTNGLNHEALLSLIQFAEFKVREGQFGYMPKGLEIGITCLGSWLYDEEQPFNKIENLVYYNELKEDVHNGYFEDIIINHILNNTHKSYVKLIPSHDVAKVKEEELNKRLALYKESLSKEEILALIEKNKQLSIYQSTPSTLEEIETLPRLELTDLNPKPEKLLCESFEDGYKVLLSDYYTSGINYITYSFDISGMEIKDLQYVKLFTRLALQLSTVNHSFVDIVQLVQKNTGGMNLSVGNFKTKKKENKTYVNLKFSALNDFMKVANDLIIDVLHNTNFKDEKRLYERLAEIKVEQEMSAGSKGHVLGLVRSASYYDESYMIRDSLEGLGYVDFIIDLFNNFENNKEEIISNLERVSKKIANKKNFLLRFTGNKKQYEENKHLFDEFYSSLEDLDIKYPNNYQLECLNEGIKMQSDVNYVARSGKFDLPYHGGLAVLNNALSLDYLWAKVRVHGGAYGCMLNIDEAASIIGFTSYRDPNLSKTNKVYEDSVEYILNMDPSDDDLLKYKIGAIGSLDPVLHVSAKGAKAQNDYLMDNTYELQAKNRREIITVTKEEIKSFAEYFKQAIEKGYICAVGNAKAIEEEKEMFKNVRNLIK